MKRHDYHLICRWTGDQGEGTASYRSYSRSHRIEFETKPAIEGSSDPAFLGDPSRHNPEDLLLASISACHMLWYLHLCSANGLILKRYEDSAEAVMEESERGGAFSLAVLKPVCTFEGDIDADQARALHAEAHSHCFIANSLNFPIHCEPVIRTQPRGKP